MASFLATGQCSDEVLQCFRRFPKKSASQCARYDEDVLVCCSWLCKAFAAGAAVLSGSVFVEERAIQQLDVSCDRFCCIVLLTFRSQDPTHRLIHLVVLAFIHIPINTHILIFITLEELCSRRTESAGMNQCA